MTDQEKIKVLRDALKRVQRNLMALQEGKMPPVSFGSTIRGINQVLRITKPVE